MSFEVRELTANLVVQVQVPRRTLDRHLQTTPNQGGGHGIRITHCVYDPGISRQHRYDWTEKFAHPLRCYAVCRCTLNFHDSLLDGPLIQGFAIVDLFLDVSDEFRSLALLCSRVDVFFQCSRKW